MATNISMKRCAFKHDLLSIILQNLLTISISLMSLLINDFNPFLFHWSLLLDYAIYLLTFTVLCYANGRVNLALHLLVFSFTFYLVPVSRFICLVRDLFWFLMWLTVVVWIDPIGVINGQISCLRLWKLPILILINLDLLFNAFKDVGVHLSRRHEAAHPALELHLL